MNVEKAKDVRRNRGVGVSLRIVMYVMYLFRLQHIFKD